MHEETRGVLDKSPYRTSKDNGISNSSVLGIGTSMQTAKLGKVHPLLRSDIQKFHTDKHRLIIMFGFTAIERHAGVKPGHILPGEHKYKLEDRLIGDGV
jgi:hypothetical protein